VEQNLNLWRLVLDDIPIVMKSLKLLQHCQSQETILNKIRLHQQISKQEYMKEMQKNEITI
jgi:hypothetical protein